MPTPIRDKLNINTDEDGMGGSESGFAAKKLKETLRNSLSRLPAPRNDYEIVVPDEVSADLPNSSDKITREDQADIDARFAAEQKAKRTYRETLSCLGK